MTQRSTKMELARQFYQALLTLGASPDEMGPARRLASAEPAEVAKSVYLAAKQLGAKSDLLRIIGSYGDTLDAGDVLEQMRVWNGRNS